MQSKPSPLVLIGLDGATFQWLDLLCQQGHMPFLKQLREKTLEGQIISTTPISTLTAWSSLLTGQEPAVHGVVDFFTRTAPSRPLEALHGGWRQCKTFLEELDEQGFAVAAVGIPGTYPALHLKHGICLSGFDTPGPDCQTGRAVWPYSLTEKIVQHGGWHYGAFNEFYRGRNWIQRACTQICQDIRQKQAIATLLQQQCDWDLFFIHLQASDTAGHHFWHLFDQQSPRHVPGHESIIPKIFRCIDQFIQALAAHLPAHGSIMIVSDHGMMGTNTTAIYLNRLLHQLHVYDFANVQSPLQALGAHVAQSWGQQVIGQIPIRQLQQLKGMIPSKQWISWFQWLRQQQSHKPFGLAFSDELDYSPSIWLTSQAHQLDPAHRLQLLERIRHGLMQLRCPLTQAPLIQHAWLRHELPSGKFSHYLPDISIEPHSIDNYRPVFLASKQPGSVVEMLPQQTLQQTSTKAFGLPGAHHRSGCFLWFQQDLPVSRYLGDISLPELGATLPLLWSSTHQKPHMHTGLAAAIFQWQARRHADKTTYSFTPQDMSITLERLQHLGYID